MNEQSDKDERESRARPGDEIAPDSYRKKPVVIQAIRWCGTNLKEVIDFTGLHPSADKWTWAEYEEVVRTKGFKLFTLEGPHMVDIGDYVIRGVKGEFYACKPDIFWMTYERASAPLPVVRTTKNYAFAFVTNKYELKVSVSVGSFGVQSFPRQKWETNHYSAWTTKPSLSDAAKDSGK